MFCVVFELKNGIDRKLTKVYFSQEKPKNKRDPYILDPSINSAKIFKLRPKDYKNQKNLFKTFSILVF